MTPAVPLHPYQKRWIEDRSRFRIGMFARQTGKTFTTTLDIVDDCFRAWMQSRRVTWVILSRGERQAREAMREAMREGVRRHAQAYGMALDEISRDFRAEDGTTYKDLEITLPGGSRVIGLPANPDTARGYSANVFLDEFAWHAKSREIWGALFPVISAGHRITITSTPNGKGNKFHDLMTGADGVWSRHRVDIYQAVADGLPRDVGELHDGLGDDDLWRQEFELEWLDEALWSLDGQRVRLADLRVRAPDRFRWANDGALLLRTRSNPRGDPVPDRKFVALGRPGESADVPHAPGLGRWCYWPVFLKRNAIKFWGIALDKFGTPTPVGHHRQNPAPGEKESLLKVLARIASGAGVALPEGQEITLLQSAARQGGDFKDFATYFDTAMTTLILGQSSTTDQGPWRGTAEIQKDVRDEVIASDCLLLDSALNTTVVRWLTAWNHPGAAPPMIVHDASPPEDLDARAQREETVGRTSGLRPTRKHVEDMYGGEWEPAPASPVHGPDTGDAGDVPPRRRGRIGPMLAAGEGEDPIGQAVNHLLAGDGWTPLMEPMVAPIRAAVDAAIARGDSLEVFGKRLPALMREMDETAVAETLHNTTFSAALSGQAGLEER